MKVSSSWIGRPSFSASSLNGAVVGWSVSISEYYGSYLTQVYIDITHTHTHTHVYIYTNAQEEARKRKKELLTMSNLLQPPANVLAGPHHHVDGLDELRVLLVLLIQRLQGRAAEAVGAAEEDAQWL